MTPPEAEVVAKVVVCGLFIGTEVTGALFDELPGILLEEITGTPLDEVIG